MLGSTALHCAGSPSVGGVLQRLAAAGALLGCYRGWLLLGCYIVGVLQRLADGNDGVLQRLVAAAAGV